MGFIMVVLGYVATFFVLYAAIRYGVAAGMEDAWKRREQQRSVPGEQ
ncbi:MAG TPA: hypothetical protein VF054_08950 [Micromonosporaceae bacterium]